VSLSISPYLRTYPGTAHSKVDTYLSPTSTSTSTIPSQSGSNARSGADSEKCKAANTDPSNRTGSRGLTLGQEYLLHLTEM
jgi:hypothetical protein